MRRTSLRYHFSLEASATSTVPGSQLIAPNKLNRAAIATALMEMNLCTRPISARFGSFKRGPTTKFITGRDRLCGRHGGLHFRSFTLRTRGVSCTALSDYTTLNDWQIKPLLIE